MTTPTFAKRLDPVRRVAQDTEDEAARRYADTQRVLAQSEAQLQEMERYLAELGAGGAPLAPSLLANREAFMHRLMEALRWQNNAISEARAKLDTARDNWLRRRSDTKMLEHLIARDEAEALRRLERRMQAQMDEFAQLRAAAAGSRA